MRNKLGNICIALGILLIFSACSLFFHNRMEAQKAQEAANLVLEEMISHFSVPETETQIPPQDPAPSSPAAPTLPEETAPAAQYPDPYDPEMAVVEIDGYGYIGYLSIPDLEKILPVMSQWDYDRLRIAPCRYMGGTKTGDLVICAHNYSSHFGDIASLHIGAEITFTDMNGIVTYYEVAEIITLAPTAIEEMESADYPLTLFTCTYGGQSRITVRCNEVIQ